MSFEAGRHVDLSMLRQEKEVAKGNVSDGLS